MSDEDILGCIAGYITIFLLLFTMFRPDNLMNKPFRTRMFWFFAFLFWPISGFLLVIVCIVMSFTYFMYLTITNARDFFDWRR